MFGMGMPEILLILAIGLIVIGPKKLPELAKSLGRTMNEFKRATNEFKDTLELDTDVKKTFDDIDAELKKPIDITPKKKESVKNNTSINQKQENNDKISSKEDKEESDTNIPDTDIPAELLFEDDKFEDDKDILNPPVQEKKQGDKTV